MSASDRSTRGTVAAATPSSGPSPISDEELVELLGSQEFLDSPFEGYWHLRARPGWQAPSGYRVFSTFEDVHAILRDPNTFGQQPRPNAGFHEMDPPDHTRLRGLVSRGFTRRAADQQEADVARAVEELLAPKRAQGHMELVGEFAEPLAAQVVAEVLGVPVQDTPIWLQWMTPIKEARGVINYLGNDDEGRAKKIEAAAKAGADARAYLAGLLRDSADTPQVGVLGALLEAQRGDHEITEQELVTTLVNILPAGLHTTATQLASTVWLLLTTDGTIDELRADPELIGNAVDEGLRTEGALQAEHRVVKQPAVISGAELNVGEQVLIIVGAANHDPAIFENPDVFDIHRANARDHLTFGWGIHRCLGAQLARVELIQAIDGLIKLPDLALAGPPVRHHYSRWRGLGALPVEWSV